MIARQNLSAPIEVSGTSASLTSPAFNSNSTYSETATFPNPDSNEDNSLCKHRRM